MRLCVDVLVACLSFRWKRSLLLQVLYGLLYFFNLAKYRKSVISSKFL